MGIWLIFTGVKLIYQPPETDSRTLDYLVGAFRILIRLNAMRTVPSVAHRADQTKNLFLRVLTNLLVIMLIGLPLLLLVTQTLATFFGIGQPDELAAETVTRIIFTAVCYLLATLFAGWR